ncbi:ribose-5-phosphate isomerase RpiA [Rhodoblastus acidophilus]|uniref:Ribose-5-phosphate isomerase A n=1 Tax=Rhodoblastus acidophilus TaxID=1074 RepID=A0A6N8DMQ1_RHOAC|nr:ribose-5-phosphate isomerase RpiA [Rhodoblastus acidophilus]MCW2274251.1 ribose 5-phosphate isomerase A [Rhodoblastus acidophilus]MTV30815.1 ribose-5-phosphate isomerase RpiA [Rhodoblastus acidophilus]
MSLSPVEQLKRQAAERAAALVRSGMKLGLGTGSTAAHFVDCIGEKVRDGLDVICVPTSERTRAQAEGLNIKLSTLDETPELDLTVDGADEFDPKLRLIKGGGGALLREKIVAAASRRMVVITDASKEVEKLGKFKLPVEADLFGLTATARQIELAAKANGCHGPVSLRYSAPGARFITDGGNAIFDCDFGVIPDPDGLAAALNAIPGVVEHGLFIGLATAIIIADPAGIRVLGDLSA